MVFVWAIAGFVLVIWWVLRFSNFRWLARSRMALANAATSGSVDARIVDCAHCGQSNRLRPRTDPTRYRCGACQQSLPNPFAPPPAPPPTRAQPEVWFRPSGLTGAPKRPIVFRDLQPEQRSVTADDVADVVDAFTGEGLKPALGLFQCFQCEVYYHRASVETLKAENGGQCVACLSISIRPVTLTSPHRGFRSATAEPPVRATLPAEEPGGPVTLINFREHVGRVVSFEGFVPRVLASPKGRHFAIMFQNRKWSQGFKAVVLRTDLAAVGGEPFVRNLEGRTIRIRGLVQQHEEFGHQIVLSERGMIEDIR